jgi:hypothetical protein
MVVVAGFMGLGVEGSLQPTSLAVPGTESARARALLQGHFDESAPFAIVLRGPSAAVDRQGPALLRALRRIDNATILSPWDRAQWDRLRPSPRKALILADFHVSTKQAVKDTLPALDRALSPNPPIHPDG